MFEKMYSGIGGKIKNWAKGIFVSESISCIIIGLVLLFRDSNDKFLFLYGIIVLFLGPVAAWISTWLLYAFGELVEDVHAVRTSYCQQAYEEMYRKEIEKDSESPDQKEVQMKKATQCECGEMFYGIHCPVCGRKGQ